MSDVAEILLAQIWNSQWFSQPLQTVCGREIRVIYPGVWTHGFGPDFTGSMIDVDGQLLSGDVEIDLRPSGWSEHGHDCNPRFDDVILQIVAHPSEEPLSRRIDGKEVPRVPLLPHLEGDLENFVEMSGLRPLGRIGFESCAPDVARAAPQLVQDLLQQAGDRRMNARASEISGELAIESPGQVLYARLLDALGFSRNREAMGEVAARLRWPELASRLEGTNGNARFTVSAGLLLGVAGFLPLSPRDAAAADLSPVKTGEIERAWNAHGNAWHRVTVSPGLWTTARIRPNAHPVRRLLAMAWLLGSLNGTLVEQISRLLNVDHPLREIRTWLVGENPYLGADHGHELIANVIVPFGIAYGETASQPAVAEAAADLWSRLPAGRGNSVTRRTMRQICGETELKPKSARAEQGLIHINRNGCQLMRCYECPVAHLALLWEQDPGKPASLQNTGHG